jgi:hypothetical protein
VTLTEARQHIGESVIYNERTWDDRGKTDAGVITSVGNRFVFVRYGDDTGSKATDPAMLWLDDTPGDDQ